MSHEYIAEEDSDVTSKFTLQKDVLDKGMTLLDAKTMQILPLVMQESEAEGQYWTVDSEEQGHFMLMPYSEVAFLRSGAMPVVGITAYCGCIVEVILVQVTTKL